VTFSYRLSLDLLPLADLPLLFKLAMFAPELEALLLENLLRLPGKAVLNVVSWIISRSFLTQLCFTSMDEAYGKKGTSHFCRRQCYYYKNVYDCHLRFQQRKKQRG
jgi:hypothetical protein